MKNNQCPYYSNGNICTHKGILKNQKGKKRKCGFKQAKNCPMYNEWLELKMCCERASMGLIEHTELEGEYNDE